METERRRKRDYCNTLATQGKESVQTLDRMRKVKRKKGIPGERNK